MIITDYRGLAKKGECYAEATFRLFGTTPPVGRMFESLTMQDILMVINTVSSVQGVKLESFGIGQNPFATISGMLSERYDHFLGPEVFRNTRPIDDQSFNTASFLGPFAGLKNLRLSFHDDAPGHV